MAEVASYTGYMSQLSERLSPDDSGVVGEADSNLGKPEVGSQPEHLKPRESKFQALIDKIKNLPLPKNFLNKALTFVLIGAMGATVLVDALSASSEKDETGGAAATSTEQEFSPEAEAASAASASGENSLDSALAAENQEIQKPALDLETYAEQNNLITEATAPAFLNLLKEIPVVQKPLLLPDEIKIYDGNLEEIEIVNFNELFTPENQILLQSLHDRILGVVDGEHEVDYATSLAQAFKESGLNSDASNGLSFGYFQPEAQWVMGEGGFLKEWQKYLTDLDPELAQILADVYQYLEPLSEEQINEFLADPINGLLIGLISEAVNYGKIHAADYRNSQIKVEGATAEVAASLLRHRWGDSGWRREGYLDEEKHSLNVEELRYGSNYALAILRNAEIFRENAYFADVAVENVANNPATRDDSVDSP